MCHSVTIWPFILPIYLAYPRLVSRMIKLVQLSLGLRYSLPQCFPEEKYDTLEYSKVKCYNGDSMHLQNIYSFGHKNARVGSDKLATKLWFRSSGITAWFT